MLKTGILPGKMHYIYAMEHWTEIQRITDSKYKYEYLDEYE